MNSFSFITNILDKLSREFSGIVLRYHHDKLSDVHFVEVSPPELFLTEDYIDSEVDITDEFYSNFPNENICFFSSSDEFKLQNIDLIYKGEFEISKWLDAIFYENNTSNVFTKSKCIHANNETYSLAA